MPSLKEPSTAFGNGMLSALPRAEYERLSPHLELVRLAPGKILYNAGDTVNRGGDSSVSWTGKLVTSGTVSGTVNKDGQVFNLQKDVTVKARSWAFQAKAPRKVAHGTVVQSVSMVIASPNEPKVNTELGIAQLFPRYSFTPGEVGDGGPNHGFKYVTEVREVVLQKNSVYLIY